MEHASRFDDSCQFGRRDRLRAVAHRDVGVGVDLDDQAVGPAARPAIAIRPTNERLPVP